MWIYAFLLLYFQRTAMLNRNRKVWGQTFSWEKGTLSEQKSLDYGSLVGLQ